MNLTLKLIGFMSLLSLPIQSYAVESFPDLPGATKLINSLPTQYDQNHKYDVGINQLSQPCKFTITKEGDSLLITVRAPTFQRERRADDVVGQGKTDITDPTKIYEWDQLTYKAKIEDLSQKTLENAQWAKANVPHPLPYFESLTHFDNSQLREENPSSQAATSLDLFFSAQGVLTSIGLEQRRGPGPYHIGGTSVMCWPGKTHVGSSAWPPAYSKIDPFEKP